MRGILESYGSDSDLIENSPYNHRPSSKKQELQVGGTSESAHSSPIQYAPVPKK